MPKFRNGERIEIQNIVADLSIKRIPDSLIVKYIFNQTGKTISTRSLRYIRQRIKKESFKWYSQLREGQYEYLHEFKERINEIIDLQRQHHEIIIRNQDRPGILQTSLIELHKLNVTLSNYYDIAPYIVSNIGNINNNNDNPISIKSEDKEETTIIV